MQTIACSVGNTNIGGGEKKGGAGLKKCLMEVGLLWAYYHQCHWAAAVPGMPLALKVTVWFGLMGPGGLLTSVYAHYPFHIAATVQWCLIGSDCHCTAWMEDKEAGPGNVLSRHNCD
jgi:hypothetical protein